MNPCNYEIIDSCRRNLTKYTVQAFEMLPKMRAPLILDAGGGTGESTLALLGRSDGFFHVADTDAAALDRLRAKAEKLDVSGRISIISASVFDEVLDEAAYDLVLAEGLLNVIGMEAGLPRLKELTRTGGYLIIHDEWKDDAAKRELFARRGLTLLASFELDEKVWRDEYFQCMEDAIRISGREDLFQDELRYIRASREKPLENRSIFYILQNRRR
jgi:SAM-dependent methyltransferase